MRHENHRQMQPLLQLQEQIDHLRLHRNVERRHKLIGNDDVGLDSKRPGNADALALAARKLMRITTRSILRQAHEFQELGDAAGNIGGRSHLVDAQRLADDLLHRHAWIERAVGVLKDHLDTAVEAAPIACLEMRDVLTFETNSTFIRIEQSHEAACKGGLAAAGSRQRCQAFRRDTLRD